MRETEHYSEWVSAHRTDLETEFLATVTPPVLDDDIPDFLDDNNDDFMEYCDEAYSNADHEVYPPRGQE